LSSMRRAGMPASHWLLVRASSQWSCSH